MTAPGDARLTPPDVVARLQPARLEGSRPDRRAGFRPDGLLAARPPLVEIRDLRLAYHGREVLHGIDLDIVAGERVALVGPNGAGKSSLLRCLTGTARERRGRVLLDGRPIETLPREAIARRVAVVPQPAALPFAMPVEEVVALGRLPHEHPLLGPRTTDRLAIAAAIERVGIGHLVGRDARELSLGERQLVLVAMAIAQQGKLLALDEPTVHLDLRHQVATMESLTDLSHSEGVTVLSVLHDLSLAGHFFDRIVVMHEGRLVADGPAGEVLTDGLIRDVFGVDPDLVVRLHRRDTRQIDRSPASG